MSTFRIPLELQAVFLKSNQGKEVVKAPPSAVKVFRNFVGLLRKGPKPKRGKHLAAAQPDVTDTSQRTDDLEVSNSGTKNSASTIGSIGGSVSDLKQQISPQQWVEETLTARGYDTTIIRTIDTDYFNPPTPYQLASYNAHSVDVCTRNTDLEALRAMLYSGLSPNASNVYGETLMHKACRLGHAHVLRVFVEFGAELKTSDEQGRTLLHDACWAPRPALREFVLLLQADPKMLFLADCRGTCPLDYIPKDDYAMWIDFFERNVDRFWPQGSIPPTQLQKNAMGKPGSRPIPDPANALSLELAEMVAKGRLTPREAMQLKDREEAKDSEDGEDSSSEEEDCSSSSIDDGEYTSSSGETSHGTQDDLHMFKELGITTE